MTNQAKIVITAEDKTSSVLRGVLGSVQSTVAAFAALGSGVALGAVTRLVGALDDLADTARGIGVSAESLSAFQLSARAAGVSSEELSAGLGKFSQVLEDARSGSKEAESTVQALGIGLRELRSGSLTTEGALARAADSLAKYADGFEKTALARDAFGRGGAKFITFLSEGSDGLRKFGGVSQQAVDEAGKLQNEIDQLAASWEKLKLSVGGAIAGIVNATLELKRGSLDSQLETTQRALNEINEALERAKPGSRIETNLLAQLKAETEKLRQIEQTIIRRDFVGPPAPLERAPVRAQQPRQSERPRAEEISEASRELAQFVSQLERQRDVVEEITDVERALQLLRANPAIDTPQVRELLFLEIDRTEAARQRRIIDEEIRRINAEELAQTRALRDQVLELAGVAEEERKRKLTEQLEILIEQRALTAEQAERAVNGIAGIRDEIDKTKDATEQFGLAFASSIGNFIEDGGRGGVKSFFEALLQDLLKLTTQLLIVKPLAEAVKEAFSGGPGGSGGGLGNIFGKIGDSISSLFAGFFADGGFIPPGRFGVVGERGPELAFGGRSGQTISPMGGPTININLPPGSNVTRQTANQIAGAVSRQLAIANRRNG
jgi:HAMP domain-containing protein